MTAYFIVRAEVAEADRDAFDRWYETEHLPDAKTAFGCRAAFRGWSDVEPGIHIAFYEFADAAAAKAATGEATLKPLIAEFNAKFPNVTRSRDIVEVKQRL